MPFFAYKVKGSLGACPCCGSNAHVSLEQFWPFHGEPMDEYSLICKKCHISVNGSSENEVLTLWKDLPFDAFSHSPKAV